MSSPASSWGRVSAPAQAARGQVTCPHLSNGDDSNPLQGSDAHKELPWNLICNTHHIRPELLEQAGANPIQQGSGGAGI